MVRPGARPARKIAATVVHAGVPGLRGGTLTQERPLPVFV